MRENNDMRLPWYFDKFSNHTTALQPNGGVVGLSHRGSRRINGKFVGDLWQVWLFCLFLQTYSK
jgi:hypothetical protein